MRKKTSKRPNLTVDIIIPFQRSIEYLPRLLDSLGRQSYGSMSLTFVDDASNDGSHAYLTEFAKRSTVDVRILTNSGRGPGCARNTGVTASRADYVTFIDSDDYVSDGHVSGLMKKAEKLPDIVESMFLAVDEKGLATSKTTLKAFIEPSSRMSQICQGSTSMVTWGKAYRREFLISHGIEFLPGAINGEDHIFSLRLYSVARSIELAHQYSYFWCRRGSSVTNRPIDEATVNDLIAVNAEKLNILARLDSQDPLKFTLIRILQEIQRRRRDALAVERHDLFHLLTDHAAWIVHKEPDLVAEVTAKKPELARELGVNAMIMASKSSIRR